MSGWIVQWNGYVPAAVKCSPSALPGWMLGVAQPPASSVALCAAAPVFENVTVSPTLAVIADGSNEKSLIETATVPAPLASAQAAPPADAADAADAAGDDPPDEPALYTALEGGAHG